MRMGMVTAHLRQAEELAGPLGDVSIWGFSTLSLGLIYWTLIAKQLEAGWCGGHASWEIWLVLSQGILWTIVLARSSPDRVAFATGSLTLVFMQPILALVETVLTGQACATNYSGAVLVGPMIIGLSIAGPARVAQVPAFGPVLVRMVFGFCHSAHHPTRQGSGVEE